MAIRDRIRHALRKSEASDAITQTSSNTSNSSNSSNTTTSTANTSQSSDTGASLQKSSSRLFGFGSRDKEPKASKASKTNKTTKEKKRRLHPSEKPLTAQNLRHQELLSHFTMTFGASDPEQIESLSFIGVSPCCTRRNSISLDISSEESTPVGSSAASTL
mgnify:CR=1 FL=1